MKRKKLFIFALIFLLLPAHSLHAVTKAEELNSLISVIDRTSSKKIEHFQKKLEDFFFNVNEAVIKKLLHETSPGETAAILCFAGLSGQTVKKISDERKQKTWEAISRETNVSMGSLIRAIKSFRNSATCSGI